MSTYFVRDSAGRVYGPIGIEVVAAWVRDGRVRTRTSVQAYGTTVWRSAGEYPELALLLRGGSARTAVQPHFDGTDWYFMRDGARHGPVPSSTLIADLRSGRVRLDTPVWSRGMQAWCSARDAPGLAAAAHGSVDDAVHDNLVGAVSGAIHVVTGVERIGMRDITHLFSQIFRRHTREEMETVVSAGMHFSTPSIEQVATTLPTPWVFSRMLFLVVLLVIVSMWSRGAIVVVLIVGGMGPPLVWALFWFECNVLRSISLISVLYGILWGTIISFSATFILTDLIGGLGDLLRASIAGFTEEPAKLLAAVLLATVSQRRFVLNGMVLGAAVGTGFAAFETILYIFFKAPTAGAGVQLDNMMSVMYGRGLCTLVCGTHVLWTAVTAGALWKVRRGGSLSWGSLLDQRFLAPFLTVVALHGTWNSKLADEYYPWVYIGISLVGWVLAFGLLRDGLREVRQAQAGAI